MRRALRLAAAALALAVLAAALGLALAHREIRSRDPELPGDDEVLALLASAEAPQEVHWHETASQSLPRRQVLDPARDAEPDAPYVMAHSAFALAWPDGRLLLVDLGMEHEAAVAFAAPLRWVGGGIPLTFGGPAVALGPAVSRVAGALATHLHPDHVEGVVSLCAARSGGALPFFQTPAQADLSNYTTRPGRRLLEQAGCVAPRRLAGGALAPVPGFGGVGVVDAAGHTPGSQVVLARLAGSERRLAFTGDIANHVEGIRQDVGKPFLYGLLVVPEHEARLARVRQWLLHLERDLGFELLVPHDEAQLRGLGLAPFDVLRGADAH